MISYPIAYFLSALPIVWRNIFSAFAVRVLAWIKEIPKGFDLGDMGVLGEEDIDVVESGGDGVGTT